MAIVELTQCWRLPAFPFTASHLFQEGSLVILREMPSITISQLTLIHGLLCSLTIFRDMEWCCESNSIFWEGFMRLFGGNDSEGRRLAETDPCFNDSFRGRLGWDPSIRHGPWLAIVLNINLLVTALINGRSLKWLYSFSWCPSFIILRIMMICNGN